MKDTKRGRPLRKTVWVIWAFNFCYVVKEEKPRRGTGSPDSEQATCREAQSHLTNRTPGVFALTPAIKSTSSQTSPPWSTSLGQKPFPKGIFTPEAHVWEALTFLLNNHFILLRKTKLSNPGRKTHSLCQVQVNSRQFYFALSLHLPFIDILMYVLSSSLKAMQLLMELETLIHSYWHRKLPLLDTKWKNKTSIGHLALS